MKENILNLSASEITQLRIEHKSSNKKRDADRIKAVILLATGWTALQVAEVLLMDDGTVRSYGARYEKGGLNSLLKDNYKAKISKLSDKEQEDLSHHIDAELYMTVQSIINYVKKAYGIVYSISGMNDLLHRMDFVYKKPKVVPGKANAEAQEEFIKDYAEIKENKGKNDPIYFMDGTHPQHNTMAAYGWIRRGKLKEIKSNTGRQRVNINGAIDVESFSSVIHIDNSINAQSTICLLKKIEIKHSQAGVIYVVCDNAGYYRSKLVKEYLDYSKIMLVFLPPYSPNLNLIERYWKFFKKKVLYNQYYETYDEFKKACKSFFRKKKKYQAELKSLLTENFQIINA